MKKMNINAISKSLTLVILFLLNGFINGQGRACVKENTDTGKDNVCQAVLNTASDSKSDCNPKADADYDNSKSESRDGSNDQHEDPEHQQSKGQSLFMAHEATNSSLSTLKINFAGSIDKPIPPSNATFIPSNIILEPLSMMVSVILPTSISIKGP